MPRPDDRKTFSAAAPPRHWARGLSWLIVLLCAEMPQRGAIAGDAERAAAAASDYAIPGGSLDDALQAFAAQARIQLLYAPPLVRGKRSAGLRGRSTPPAALARLLAGQALTAVAVNRKTYLLQAVPANRRSGPRRASIAAAPRPQAPPAVVDLAPVDVTGTRIPRTSFETATPVTVITEEEIVLSGAGTLYELLREQPGMLGHHPVAVASEGGQSFQPMATAAATSLYALGPRATLLLVDGRRAASFGMVSAELGGLFDLNGIPLSFIDRIEILRGGASAIYGADAMAGTVNIVLKKDRQGTAFSTRFGISARGDARTSQASASFGAQTRAGGHLFLSADAFYRDALEGDRRSWHTADLSRFGLRDDRVPIESLTPWGDALSNLPACAAAGNDPDSPFCRFDAAMYRTLQPELQGRHVYGYWQHPLGDAASIYASVRRARIEQTLQAPPLAAYLPLPQGHPDALSGQGSLLFYPFYDLGPVRNRSISDTQDLALGFEGTVGEWGWKVDLSRSEGRVRSAIDGLLRVSRLDTTRLNRYRLFGQDNSAVLDEMRATIHPGGRDVLDAFEASIDGPVFAAPGGPARFVAGLAARTERMVNTPDPLQVGSDLSLAASDVAARDERSHSAAAFFELELPLHRTLQVDLAARLAQDHRFPSRTSPRVGVKWTPHPRLLLRASAGRGYRAPSLQDRRNPFDAVSWRETVQLPPAPPLLPCRTVGDWCDLDLGTAENPHLRPESSRSFTAGIAVTPVDAFDLSLDHYRIVRRNEFGIADPVEYPELFPEGLVRDGEGVLYRIDRHLSNIGRSESRGWELEARYFLASDARDDFSFRLGAHYLDHYVTSSIVAPAPVDRAGHDMPKLTVLASAQWRRGDWTTTLATRHFGRSHAYPADQACPQANRDAGKCDNPSTTLVGLNLDYAASGRWTFSLNINNLFDRQPINYRSGRDGYDIAVDDPYGRYYTLSAAYRF